MKTFTRKEIASANSVSSNTVKRRERDLGLSGCRDKACRKPIRYNADKASEYLSRSGWNTP